MIANVCVGFVDYYQSKRFYDAVMPHVGMLCCHDYEGKAFAYGPSEGRVGLFWVLRPYNRDAATAGNGVSIGLLAPSRSAVDAFYAAALSHGGVDEGAPGLRPKYHDHFYGAYVRDPVGNKLLCVCHQPE